MTAAPVSCSAAFTQGVEVEADHLAVEPEHLLARADRARVVLARPPSRLRHGRILTAAVTSAPRWRRRSWTGALSPSASAARWPARWPGWAPLGLATVLVGDDPASDIYIRNKHTAAREVGIDARDYRLPKDASRGGRARPGCRAERGRRAWTASSSSSRCPSGIDENRVIRAVDPAQGRGRLPPLQRRPALPRRPHARAGHAARDHGAPRRVRRRARGREGRGDRAQPDRREAHRPPAAAGERHRDRLPLAHGRPRRPGPRGGRARGRGRPARPSSGRRT